MAARMILIRHGDTGFRWGTFVGSTDVPLKQGEEKVAVKLGKRLAKEGVKAVYSSRLERAAKTADGVAEGLGTKVRKRFAEFNEVDFGKWEMMWIKDIEREYPEELNARRKDAWRNGPPGGENYSQVAERAVPVIMELFGEHEGETFAIVTHGSLMKALHSRLGGVPADEVKKNEYGFLCALFFKKDGDKIELEKTWGVKE